MHCPRCLSPERASHALLAPRQNGQGPAHLADLRPPEGRAWPLHISRWGSQTPRRQLRGAETGPSSKQAGFTLGFHSHLP